MPRFRRTPREAIEKWELAVGYEIPYYKLVAWQVVAYDGDMGDACDWYTTQSKWAQDNPS